MATLNLKKLDSNGGTSGAVEVVAAGDLSGQDLCQSCSHTFCLEVDGLPSPDRSREGAESREYANFLPLIGGGGLLGRSLMTELHPTLSGAKLQGLLLAEKQLLYLCILLFPSRSKSSVLQGHPDSDLRAAAAFEPWTRAGLCLQAARGGRVADRRGRPGPLGTWQSDQGVFCLEAGGAARAGADAGQQRDLCAARSSIAASCRVVVFGTPAQEALRVPAPPLPPQLCLHLRREGGHTYEAPSTAGWAALELGCSASQLHPLGKSKLRDPDAPLGRAQLWA